MPAWPWQRPRDPAVSLAIKQAEVEAERKQLDRLTGADVKKAEAEARLAERREERAKQREDRRWRLVEKAQQDPGALRVLEILEGKRAPADPMQTLMYELIARNLDRDPLQDYLRIREVVGEREGGKDDDGGMGGYVKALLAGFGQAAAQNAPAIMARMRGEVPMQPSPAPAGLLPAEVAMAQAQAAQAFQEQQENQLAGIPTPDEVMMRLMNGTPQQFARWALSVPAVQGVIDRLADYDDEDVIPELQKVRGATLLNPTYFAARATLEKMGYLPVLDYLLTHPDRTLEIAAAARAIVDGDEEEDDAPATGAVGSTL